MLVNKSAIAPSGTCRYGGTQFDLGDDSNGDGKLQPSEQTASIASCDGDIATIAQSVFIKSISGIALVITKLDYASAATGQCACAVGSGQQYQLPASLDEPTPGSVALAACAGTAQTTSGTGWLASDSLLVTNAHVIDKGSPAPCLDWYTYATASLSLQNSMRADPYHQWPLEYGYLGVRHVDAYFPQKSLSPAALLDMGLPHYASFDPSAADFERVTVAEYDDAPTKNTSDQADLAFLHVAASGRTVFSVSPRRSPATRPPT